MINRRYAKRLGWLLFLVPSLLYAQNNVAGEWIVTLDVDGVSFYQKLTLTGDNSKLGGFFNVGEIEGTVSGNTIHFVTKDENGNTAEYNGTISGDDMLSFERELGHRKYTARRMPQRPGPPQRYEFTPTTFYNEFSDQTKPVLTIWPGDTVHTTTVDAGGTDEHDVRRVGGGNPETGPFYIQTAMPGDVLAVHFTRVRLNRDWAISDDFLVPRVLDPNFAVKMKGGGRPMFRWRLDRERGVATTTNPGEHLKNFSIPLRPMMGCVAVAPKGTPMPTGDSGTFGGNMDLNDIVEGVTVYLPVSVPGALLYVGDGHAVQGDGELTGNALETSMEVEFTVNVVSNTSIMTPRVESPTHLIAVGLAGSLDDALRSATAGLAQWLEQDYKLTPSEIAQVLGTAAEYSVNEAADRNAGIVAKINKKNLTGLATTKP